MMKLERAIDCHAHVFSAQAPAVAGARYRPAYAATLEAWREAWKTAGTTHGVLVQPSFFGTDNREMLAAVARDRVHLRAVAVVDPSFDEEALARLDDAGVVALRLNLHGVEQFDPFFDAAWRTLLQRAAALGWHLEIFGDAGALPAIARVLQPIDISVVFDHFAFPDGSQPERTFEALERLATERETWCKLSAPYRLRAMEPAHAARQCIAAVGEGRVLWGSDWPFTRHESAASYAAMRSGLSKWVRGSCARVLWDNAARLYRFD
jgi:predicted TIM-barrel fold metal-dependent hydrolase